MTDDEWFWFMIPEASDAEIESFCERVAIKVAEGIEENEARRQAYDARITDTK